MATTTTNLGLTKPTVGEHIDISVINNNMDLLDIPRYTNPNLLINGDFAVNQTGIVSGQAYRAWQRFIDRWSIGYSGATDNVVWTQGAVTLNNGSHIFQYLEMLYTDLFGKTFTVTVKKSDGTFHSATLAFPSAVNGETISNYAPIDDVGGIQFGFEYRSGGVVINGIAVNHVPYLMLGSNCDQTLKRVKLEVGNTSTLFMDAPVDYGTELQKCKRYYELSENIYIKAPGVTGFDQTFKYSVEKRTTPTLSLYSFNNTPNKVGYYNGNAWIDVDPASASTAEGGTKAARTGAAISNDAYFGFRYIADARL